MPDEIKTASESNSPSPGELRDKIRLEACGPEMVEKAVKLNGIAADSRTLGWNWTPVLRRRAKAGRRVI